MYFPEVSRPSYEKPEREDSDSSGNYSSATTATSYDSIYHSSQRGSRQSEAQRYAQQMGQQYGKEYMKKLEEYYTEHVAPRSRQYSGEAATSYDVRQRGVSLSDAQRYAQQHAQQYGQQDNPKYLKDLEAYYTQHVAPRSGQYAAPHSGYSAQPTEYAPAPVNPQRARQVRSSDDGPLRGHSFQSIAGVSEQTYSSAASQGLSVCSDVKAALAEDGLVIESFSFINGIHLAVHPSALPHYKKIRQVVQNIEGGPELISLLESPSLRGDLTVLVTTPHWVSPDVTISFPFWSRDDNTYAHQSIVHFAPFYGIIGKDGKYGSPMITCYHELTHAHQQLLVSRGDISSQSLHIPTDFYGARHPRAETLAVQEQNKLAAYLGQSVILGYGGDAAARYRVKDFDSAIPIDQNVENAIKNYRQGEMTWNALGHYVSSVSGKPGSS